MIITINGDRYNFEIVSQDKENDFLFFIRAICKSTQRFSCINNLNTVLSEFNIEIDDPKVSDSTWIVKKEEALYLEETAREFLSSSFFLGYVEKQLDEDRFLGEWENKVNN